MPCRCSTIENAKFEFLEILKCEKVYNLDFEFWIWYLCIRRSKQLYNNHPQNIDIVFPGWLWKVVLVLLGTVLEPVPLFKGLQGVNCQYFVGEGKILFYILHVMHRNQIQNPNCWFFTFFSSTSSKMQIF